MPIDTHKQAAEDHDNALKSSEQRPNTTTKEMIKPLFSTLKRLRPSRLKLRRRRPWPISSPNEQFLGFSKEAGTAKGLTQIRPVPDLWSGVPFWSPVSPPY